MQEVQANTQTVVRIGPAVEWRTNRVPVTTLNPTTADQAELLKPGGVATVDISGNTWSAVSDCDGWYDLTLTTSNLDTEGISTVIIQDESLILPLFVDIAVLSQAAWASKYGAKDTGYMTVDAADTVWDEVLTGATHNVSSSAGRRLRQIESLNLRYDTAQAGGNFTITLDSGASATDDLYIGNLISIAEGTGAGQARTIVHYDGSTKVATVNEQWEINPDNTSVFQIFASRHTEHIHHGLAVGGAAGSITLDSGASSTNDLYKNLILHIVGGTGKDQCRLITGYNGGTKIATITPDFEVSPDSTSIYNIDLSARIDIALIEGADPGTTIATECGNALSSYDPPTKAELDNAESNIIADTGATETALDSAITAAKNAIIADTGATETVITNAIIASEGNVITEVDVNETKIDTLTTNVASVPAAVFERARSSHTTPGTFGEAFNHTLQIGKGRWEINSLTNQLVIYDGDDTTPLFSFNLYDASGNPTSINPAQRIPV